MRLSKCIVIIFAIALILIPTSCDMLGKKIGVLFITGGIEERYKLDWWVGFVDHLFPVWPKGFLAGGSKEGATCYTLIHYASEAEAFICGVNEGTPIDAFCNEYTGTYPVHSLRDHWDTSTGGDTTFFTDCFNDILPAVVFTAGHSTVDPQSQQVIEGPHIDDPAGSGIGIADFVELNAFEHMGILYRMPGNRYPSTKQDLEWFYGNDVPAYYDFTPRATELTNIKDRLARALPGYRFVFRHGSEAYMKNLDSYGNPLHLSYSTETAIDELINKEKVDRIIVLVGAPDTTNMTLFGSCWLDENGQGVSALPGKTVRQCLEDLTDGRGPTTQKDLDDYLTNKPWPELMKVVVPEVEHMVKQADPSMRLSVAPALAKMEDYEQAILAMLNYTVDKYSIPQTASLKVILSAHGLSAGWRNVLECDCYFREIEEATSRYSAFIKNEFAWSSGKFEVVSGGSEMSETEHDPVSAEKPFGSVWSTGEHIDAGINGTYINELGQVIDNGTDNYEYIILIPISFVSDSSDTLVKGRKVLGNNVSASIQGRRAYARDGADADGSAYNAEDFDSEYFTVKDYDAAGWSGVPGCIDDPDCAAHNEPVNKGSATKPTRAIITGTILSRGNCDARTHLTEAAVKSVIAAIKNPDIGGHGDTSCVE